MTKIVVKTMTNVEFTFQRDSQNFDKAERGRRLLNNL
jgi:hypothetical protein